MPQITLKQAFERIAQASYVKQWDTSGECMVLREAWTDGSEAVQREHNFLEDNPAPVPETVEPAPASDADVTHAVSGVEAVGDVGKTS